VTDYDRTASALSGSFTIGTGPSIAAMRGATQSRRPSVTARLGEVTIELVDPSTSATLLDARGRSVRPIPSDARTTVPIATGLYHLLVEAGGQAQTRTIVVP
jgi:hypothetical protein